MCTSYGPTAARAVSGLQACTRCVDRSDSVSQLPCKNSWRGATGAARDGRRATVGVLHDARFRHARFQAESNGVPRRERFLHGFAERLCCVEQYGL